MIRDLQESQKLTKICGTFTFMKSSDAQYEADNLETVFNFIYNNNGESRERLSNAARCLNEIETFRSMKTSNYFDTEPNITYSDSENILEENSKEYNKIFFKRNSREDNVAIGRYISGTNSPNLSLSFQDFCQQF